MKLIFPAVAVCLANAASALTVTFDHNNVTYNPTNGEHIGLSQGFQYDFSYTYLTGYHIALHDDSGLLGSTVKRQDGSRFTPQQIDVAGFSNVYKSLGSPKPTDLNDAAWFTTGIAPPVSLVFEGIRNGSVVATQSILNFERAAPWGTTVFSDAFKAIDKLVLSLGTPAGAVRDYYFPSYIGPDTVWCDQWCGEFRADNLVVSQVAPVPLPAAGWLLIGAMAGLFGFRRITAR